MDVPNPPAFPRPSISDGISLVGGQVGMSVRDFFAAHALTGLLAYTPRSRSPRTSSSTPTRRLRRTGSRTRCSRRGPRSSNRPCARVGGRCDEASPLPHSETAAMTTATKPPPVLGDLIEQFPITFPDGTRLHAALHRHAGPHARRGGRRIVVYDRPGGNLLFDTDECYDSANAISRLTEWIAKQIGEAA